MKQLEFSKKQIDQFKKIGVEAVYLFGSQSTRTAQPLSDFDIGVLLHNPQAYENDPLGIYSKLYDIFIDALPQAYLKKRLQLKKHEFDLVFLQSAPVNLQFNAINQGQVLYEQDPGKRLDYQENVLKRYADLKYFYDLSYKHLLERL